MNRTIKCPDCDRRKSRFNDATTVRYSKVYDERIPNSDTIKSLAETCDPIEEYIENDIIGHRKTKKMGTYSVDYAEKVEKIMDSLNSSYLGIDKNNLNPNLYSSKYLNALAVLGIDNKNASIEEIKSSFKKIVKELHPDTVGNDKSKTDKLTKVLESYKTLKEYYEQFKRPINK